ncbi:MAG: transcriptional regulator BetI [Pseudomonadota bacterium]
MRVATAKAAQVHRTGTEALRKRELIDATIFEIGQLGSLNVTVSQIARKAGVSSALAHHYFGSKDQIFLAAMRHVLTVFADEVHALRGAAYTPRGRVAAIVRACFSDTNFQPQVISAWLNFYVLAQTSPEAARLLRVYQNRLITNLTHEMRPLADTRAPDIAQGTAAMIDGLYIRHALRSSGPDGPASVDLIERYIDQALLS